MTSLLRTIAILMLLAGLTIGATQGMGQGPGAPGGGAMMGPGMAGPGMMPGMAGMQGSTTDVLSFLQHMIPHHQEAIASAEALLAVTERPELRALLQDVIETQTAEVELMHGWISAWFPEATHEVPYEPMMRDLGDAPVADLERAWLEDMVMHHMMAVHESRALLALDLSDHPEVAELANAIIAGQMSEMHQMMGWLADWYGMDAMGAMHGAGAMGAGMGAMQGRGGVAGGMGMRGGSGTGQMHGMGAMGGMGQMHGMGPMGMHGGAMQGMSGMGQMHGMGAMGGMGQMHGASAMGLGAFPHPVVEALARAYLAGRGGDGAVLEVGTPRVTYAVTYRLGDAEGVLLIDALTGDVAEEPGR